eukprot:gene55458-74049_t
MSLIGAFYYLRVVKVMYFDAPLTATNVSAPVDVRVVLTINGALVLGLGLLPGGLMALGALPLFFSPVADRFRARSSVSLTGSVWLIIVAAFVAANLPFVNQRWLVAGPVATPVKPLVGRLAELVLLYFVVGALALVLERRAGQIAPQGWEFYAITGTMFLTFAFPGFVYRYLLRRHHS